MSLNPSCVSSNKSVLLRGRYATPLLALICALAVIGAGCMVSTLTALPVLPPPPNTSTGTFVIRNSVPCPAGSTAANPLGGNCSISTPTGTVEVLPDGFLGGAYTAVVQTAGGIPPATFCQVQNVPTAITLNGAVVGGSCILSGIFPTTIPGLTIPPGGFATITVSVNVRDSNNPASSATATMVIRVFAGFSFTATSPLANATQARLYGFNITTNVGGGRGTPPISACTATATPVAPTAVPAFTIPQSPASTNGLQLAPSGTNCVLQGTPTVNGTFDIVVTAGDSFVPANTRTSGPLRLTINATFIMPAFAPTAGLVNAPYTFTIPTTGGQAPINCNTVVLAVGLTVNTSPGPPAQRDCQIAGTPNAATPAPLSVTATATDTATGNPGAGTGALSGTVTATANLTINKAGTTTTITSDAPDPSVTGQPYAVNWTVAPVAPSLAAPTAMTGNVTVIDGTGATCTAAVAAGTCSITSASCTTSSTCSNVSQTCSGLVTGCNNRQFDQCGWVIDCPQDQTGPGVFTCGSQ